ncbi:ankyrin repeat and SOCS box protein 3 isoform 4-T4 [Menidia menidia]
MRMDFSECYEDSVSGLAAAARSGCRRRLRALIRGGCSLDVRDNRGWTALHQAAAAGSRACVRDLLAAAGGPRARRLYADALTHEGESAMFLAAERGHLRAVRSLLDANANIDQLTNGSSCPLYAAVDGGHTDVVRLLVQRGAEVDRTHTASCWTCLHQAVYKGSVDIVRVLAGVCHLEARDDHGVSPLFVAAQYGRRECLEALISAGASVNSQASDLATPLLISSQEGHESCVALLLAHGADPNRPCSADWPQLPLHAAAQFGHLGVLRRLLAVTGRGCGAGVGWVSPLYLAVYGGQSGGLRLLLGGGFPPDAQDCSAPLGLRSPLALALQREDSEAVDLLLAAGASVSEEDWSCVLARSGPALLELFLRHRPVGGGPRWLWPFGGQRGAQTDGLRLLLAARAAEGGAGAGPAAAHTHAGPGPRRRAELPAGVRELVDSSSGSETGSGPEKSRRELGALRTFRLGPLPAPPLPAEDQDSAGGPAADEGRHRPAASPAPPTVALPHLQGRP